MEARSHSRTFWGKPSNGNAQNYRHAVEYRVLPCLSQRLRLQYGAAGLAHRRPFRRVQWATYRRAHRHPNYLPTTGWDSWKEIAAHLSRDVTTVQRWEKREGMPVHRHLHDRMGSVYASCAELDAWTRSRNLPPAPANGNNLPAPDAMAPPLRDRNADLSDLAIPGAAGGGSRAGNCRWRWLRRVEYFWRSPIANARFQSVTDFGGVEQDAAISRDGHFVAFLSDRDGAMDVRVTQAGSGEFHNLTHGSVPGLANPSIRTLGFSPDGSLITFWLRKQNGANDKEISVWAVPTLGGQPRPYLQGVAEYDWSHDGSKLTYHTPGPGDPLFVSDGSVKSENRHIFTAPAGLHSSTLTQIARYDKGRAGER
jgi:hypothetical protein